MDNNFHIEMCSGVDIEGMVIYINHKKKVIASITYEKGIDNMEIEFFPFGKSEIHQIYSLNEFLGSLEKAKQLAIKCAEEDKLRDE
jgi:hypothetical protein